MPRLHLGTALAISLTVPMATAATAQDETCTVTTGIVSSIVTLRAEGSTPAAIKRSLTSGSAISEKYKPTVAPLVDWVFTIDEAVVNEPSAAKRISGAYQETCAGYQP